MINKCLLTFDYELFLGDSSGSVSKSLIEPTNKILDVLDKKESKSVFFVDAAFLIRAKETAYEDYLLIKKQLKRIISQGSEIQLHIHPQWLDSCVEQDFWYFKSYERFRLQSMKVDEAVEYFCKCKSFLEEMAEIEVNVFRAGGWCIQPFDVFYEAFLKSGIKIDSSVTPGLIKNELPHHFFDFTNNCCASLYKFSTDPTREDTNGPYIECPVTMHSMHGTKLALNSILLKFSNNKLMGDGKGLYRMDSFDKKLKRLFLNNTRPFSVESLHPVIFQSELRKILGKENELINLVMHPKTFTEVALLNLEYICGRVKTITFRELMREIT